MSLRHSTNGPGPPDPLAYPCSVEIQASREMLGKTLRQLANEPDDALSDPLVSVETDAGQFGELGDRMRSETIECVQHARTETEREERRLSRHAVEVIGQVAAFFIARGLPVDRLEAPGPRAAHLLRAVEAHP